MTLCGGETDADAGERQSWAVATARAMLGAVLVSVLVWMLLTACPIAMAQPAEGSGDADGAAAARFVGVEGYALRVPAGWVAVDRRSSDEAIDGLSSLGVARADLRSISCVILPDRAPGDRGSPSVVVTIVPEQLRINEDLAERYASQIDFELREQGIAGRTIGTAIVSLGGVQSFVFDRELDAPSGRVTQRQYLTPGRGEYLVLTCSAPSERFDAVRPVFEAIASSLDVGGLTVLPDAVQRADVASTGAEAGSSSGSGVRFVPYLIALGVGGVVVGTAVAVGVLSRRSRGQRTAAG